MVRNLFFIFLSTLFLSTYGHSQSLKGMVKDAKSGKPIPDCSIKLRVNGSVKGGAYSDLDGKFQINALQPGSYDVEISNVNAGYQPIKRSGVIVSSDKTTDLKNLELGIAESVQQLGEVIVTVYVQPLIDPNGSSGSTVTREDIARLPVRSAAAVAGTVGGVQTNEGSGAISVRGSRSDATYYYIDGIKVRGSANLPKSALQEVSVITGGVPANYGDVTGGIISITTRGPSKTYFGSIEAVSSGIYINGEDPDGYDGKVYGLDQFGYNLFEGMLSGPLLMRRDSVGNKTNPILGFLISANYSDRLDSRPLSGGTYRIKQDVRDDLLTNPLRPTSTGFGTFHNALFLNESDFEKTAWRMNARSTSISAQGKIDVNTGPSVNLQFGGSLNYSNGNNYSYTGSLLNFGNFGVSEALDYRVFGRFTQRFTSTKESSSKIKSANYSLMVDYTKTKRDVYDPKHKYNMFNYGHVGTFETSRIPSYEFDQVTNTYIHNGFRDLEVSFTPSETNAS